MRVLHIMASAATGGGARYLLDVLPRLRSAGMLCSLITSTDGDLGDAIEESGFAVSRIDMMQSRFSPRVLHRLVRTIKKVGPDVVHLHGSRAGLYGVLAAHLAGVRSIAYTAHGIAFRADQGIWNRLPRMASEALVCQLADGVMSVSEKDLASLAGLPRVGAWWGRYVPNAVDSRLFEGGRDHGRSLLGLDSCAFVVGTVSRLVPQKAVHVLLEAASALEGITVVVVGDGSQGDELRARFGDEVVFLGERHDVPEILGALDVFVLSSGWEGEPLALLEAMAAGVACVATDTPGSRAILADGKAGILVPVGDVKAMREAIEELRSDSDLSKKVRHGAEEVVSRRSVEAHAIQVVEVYRELSLSSGRT